MKYMLKQGVQFSPEDLILIDDPRPSAAPGKRTVVNPLQRDLDLKPAPEKPREPWADADPRMTVTFTTTVSEETHKKLLWIKKNVADSAIAAVVRRAIDAEVARLLAEHYKPKA
jgi:hypothetical protein